MMYRHATMKSVFKRKPLADANAHRQVAARVFRNGGLPLFLGLAATLGMANGAQAQRDVQFGLGVQYDTGAHPCVSISAANVILETHKSEYTGTKLWYHIGRLNGTTINWGGSSNYDTGVTPACALNNRSVAVEVHKSEWRDRLFYHVGTLNGNSMSWSGSHDYDNGVTPSVAINDSYKVVEVHKSQSNSGLWYHVGTVSGNQISWGNSYNYDSGVNPRVAINNSGLVVEVHKSQNNSGLWYHVGRISGNGINWGPSRKYDDGANPSIALNADGQIVEVHKSQSNAGLWRHVGYVSGDAIQWSGSSDFDTGAMPAVATNVKVAVQAHESETFGTLWFSTSLLVDRANWMRDRYNLLQFRTLKEIALPGSHDAGMYLGGVPQSLGRTQSQSIYGQLAGGVRYFDLRPKTSGGNPYIYHGPISGPPTQDVLNDVKRFMSEGRQELVVLKFSHFDFQNNSDYTKLRAQIQNTIGSWLYTSKPQGQRIADIPLGNIIGNGGRVLVVCDDNYALYYPAAGIYVYRDWDSSYPQYGDLRVYDIYANTTSYDTMKNDQFTKFANYDGLCKNNQSIACDLFLLSWTLTPVTDVALFSKPANRNLPAALMGMAHTNRYGKIVNIVYVDYFELSHAVDTCLFMNGMP